MDMKCWLLSGGHWRIKTFGCFRVSDVYFFVRGGQSL